MRYSKPFLSSLTIIICLCLCLCISIAYAQDYPMPDTVRRYMARRSMRYHHYMWHQIRDNWNRFSEQTRRDFTELGWEPSSPSRDAQRVRIRDNYAGEDFLYMHRRMIAIARRVATIYNESTDFLESWKTIPTPDDEDYPVPPPFTRGTTLNYLAQYKTDAHYEVMRIQEERLKDPERLRGMTLNQLGLEIESGGIHTSLHYRWTNESSYGYRTGGFITTQTPNISRHWDDFQYDWMGDSYASHVYPLFWKLHGWVDDRIEDWRMANGLRSVRWRGTWIGGPMENLGDIAKKRRGDMEGMDMDDDSEVVGEVMQKAFEILQKSGVPEFTMEDADRIDRQQKRGRKVCRKKRVVSLMKAKKQA